jgi:hypothetical protein
MKCNMYLYYTYQKYNQKIMNWKISHKLEGILVARCDVFYKIKVTHYTAIDS